ncbi:MAG: WD40/YVTN/BNR-like repeat-containing protein [Desulfitobacteriaceae bacterium]
MHVRKRISHAILALILILGPIFNAIPVWAGSTSSAWSLVSSLPTGNTLSGVTYGNSLFVAVGSSGTILTSISGTDNWVSHNTGTTDLNGVACGVDGNGGVLFAAVGNSGTILVSADGTAWTQQTSGTSNSLYGVAYSSNCYVAVGQNGTILYYTLAPAAGAAVITSVRDIGSQRNGSDLEVSFNKAADESRVSEYRIMVVPVYEAVNFNVIKANAIPAGNYTTVNKTGSNITATLADTANDIDGYLLENDSTYKVFILSMADGTNATVNTLSGSSSEITLRMWNWANPRPTGNTLNGSAYGNGLYVVVGDSSSIFTSPDGTNWTNRISDTTYDLNGVVYGKGIFVAVETGGQPSLHLTVHIGLITIMLQMFWIWAQKSWELLMAKVYL